MATKTPQEVTDTIKKLVAADQVIIQTYLAKLKQTIADFEANQHTSKEEEVEAGNTHYHGHEKCTHDHGHEANDHDHAKKDHDHAKKDHDHAEKDHNHAKKDHESHDHGHSHGHNAETCGEDHKHGHGHHHEDKKQDDIPEWKKKAMDADPDAAPFGGSWNVESSVDATKEEEGLPGKRKRSTEVGKKGS